jgi:hypothetical protein
MNGIIRKRVLALFSAVGLVGSTASAVALVAQGDKTAATKTEGQANEKQGKDAGKGKVSPDYTRHKKSKAADAGSKDAAKMNKEAHIKGEKHAAETKVTQDSQHVKGENQQTHVKTMQTEGHIKGEKHAAETNASKNEANKKASQTTPK